MNVPKIIERAGERVLTTAQLAVQKAEAAIQRRAVADFVMFHPELMPYVTALPMEGS